MREINIMKRKTEREGERERMREDESNKEIEKK
jgi:hypothetical protein